MTPVTDRPCQSPATAVLRGGRLPRIYYRSELVLVASQSNWLFRGTSPYALELALGPVTTGGKCSLFLTQESFQILGLDTLHTAAATPPHPAPDCLRTGKPASPQPDPLPPIRPALELLEAEALGTLALALFPVSQSRGVLSITNTNQGCL